MSGIEERLTYRIVELAAALGVSRVSIHRMNSSGKLPLPIKLGRCTAWRKATIDEWLAMDCPDRARFEAIRAGVRGPRR